MNDKIKLAIMHVTIGNAKVKFSFLITISPGNFPKGSFIFKSIKIPIITAIIPTAMSNFAK